MNTGKYLDLWIKEKELIKNKLINSNEKQFIQLSFDRFNSVGNRKKYSFNLQYEKGIVTNNISSSAVARDLDNILSNDDAIKNVLKTGRFKINMDKNFCLWIQKN